ncbi:unnamed protein product [Brassicogethes aeneus]|uniref:Ribosome biogenesis protein SLX9 n=1 Tax=Brassicogethes aeneus TaxID=1431903 RepID=A0A9P0F8E8_BRAAE|nr:unnamed protein product [Brassicogethes aeneus]
MGKQRRIRQKLHISSQKKKKPATESMSMETAPLLPITPPKENIFAGLNIDFTNLKKNLNDDVQSVKSYKSAKSEAGSNKILPKKEKLKLRRDVLMKKIDAVNQMKKQLKVRNKRKNVSVIGDTNPLHDALPSLESLLQSRASMKHKEKEQPKKKAVEKSRKRKNNLLTGIKMIKQTLKNKQFSKNPLEAISQHVRAVVDNEKLNLILKK